MLSVEAIHASRFDLEAYGKAHPAVYAGLVIDTGPPGAIHIGFTSELERHRQELLREFPYERWLDVFQAQWSLHHLAAQAVEIEDDQIELAKAGIDCGGLGIDILANRVWLEVAVRSPAAVESLAARYPASLQVIPVEERQRIPLEILEIHRGDDPRHLEVISVGSAGLPADEAVVEELEDEVRVGINALVAPWASSFKADRRTYRTTVSLISDLGAKSITRVQSGDV